MVSIARKNLFHDKGRLTITLLGLAAALTLILFSLGMFIGTLDESVALIDHIDADLWVVSEGSRDILDPSAVPHRASNAIRRVEGVETLHRLIYSGLYVEKNDEQWQVMLVGYDLARGVGAPWRMLSGDPAELKQGNTIVVDRSIEAKFGSLALGDALTIDDVSQRVVGISQEAKWFISPFVFTSYENAQQLSGLGADQGTYILVDVRPGYDPAQVARDISRLEAVDAFVVADIRRNTRNMMIFESGMGVGIGAMVVVGLFVAAIIISLTIYTATMERVPEFGTLKAIGASRRYVRQILLEQVFVSVSLGYGVGLLCSLAVGWAVRRYTLMPVEVTPGALVATYVATLGLSILGSFSSIRRVNRVDPAIVFRA